VAVGNCEASMWLHLDFGFIGGRPVLQRPFGLIVLVLLL